MLSTRRRFTRSLVTLLALVLVSGLSACGDDSSTEASGGIQGTYALQQINGRPLPYSFGEEVWESMSLTLTADRRVVGTLRWHETDAAGATVDQGTDSFTGTYTVSGRQVAITIGDDEPVQATLDGSTLTMTSDGNTLVFRRE